MRGQMRSGSNVDLGDNHEGDSFSFVKEEGGVSVLNYCLIYYVIINFMYIRKCGLMINSSLPDDLCPRKIKTCSVVNTWYGLQPGLTSSFTYDTCQLCPRLLNIKESVKWVDCSIEPLGRSEIVTQPWTGSRRTDLGWSQICVVIWFLRKQKRTTPRLQTFRNNDHSRSWTVLQSSSLASISKSSPAAAMRITIIIMIIGPAKHMFAFQSKSRHDTN